MREYALARRYAQALCEVALDRDMLVAARDGLELFAQAYERVRLLATTLENNEIPLAKRHALVEAVCRHLQCHVLVVDFLNLLVSKGRIGLVGYVVPEYCNLVSAALACVRAEVVVADESLADEICTRIEKIISRKLSKQASCELRVDPGLVGGVVIKIGERRYDASVRGRLKRMEEELLKRGAHGY